MKFNGYDLKSVISNYGRKYHYAFLAGNMWHSRCFLHWLRKEIHQTNIAVNCKTCLKRQGELDV